jgi:hypothetical protein
MHGLLCSFSLLLIVVVSFAATEIGHKQTCNKTQCFTSVNCINSSKDNAAVNNASFSCFYKTTLVFKRLPTKKIKVRFRAMYCYFQVSQPLNAKKYLFDCPQKIVVYKDYFLHDRFAYLFNLRGPPASIS